MPVHASQGDSGSEFFVLENGAAKIVVNGEDVGSYGPTSRSAM
jgi:hypothetical protein